MWWNLSWLQLIKSIRAKHLWFHRWNGRLQVLAMMGQIITGTGLALHSPTPGIRMMSISYGIVMTYVLAQTVYHILRPCKSSSSSGLEDLRFSCAGRISCATSTGPRNSSAMLRRVPRKEHFMIPKSSRRSPCSGSTSSPSWSPRSQACHRSTSLQASWRRASREMLR